MKVVKVSHAVSSPAEEKSSSVKKKFLASAIAGAFLYLHFTAHRSAFKPRRTKPFEMSL